MSVIKLPPPPRPIRPTHPRPNLKAIAWLMCAAVVVIVLALAGWLLNELALKVLGRETDATVSSVYERRGPSGELLYVARYAYARPGGGERSDESAVSFAARRRLVMPNILAGARETEALRPGPHTGIKVRAYSIGGFEFSRAVEDEWAG